MAKKIRQVKKFYQGTGRRKTSTASARLFEEASPLLVNGQEISVYFPGEEAAKIYQESMVVAGLTGRFGGQVRVSGGGKTGQLEAVALAIARALVGFDENLRLTLSHAGLLRRDPRMVERKKVFHKGARRAPQYSKR